MGKEAFAKASSALPEVEAKITTEVNNAVSKAVDPKLKAEIVAKLTKNLSVIGEATQSIRDLSKGKFSPAARLGLKLKF